MIKKFLLFLVILLIGVSVTYGFKLKEKRTLIIPYPYAFTDKFILEYTKEEADNIIKAQNATILIVGDRMARSLIPYELSLQETFGDRLKRPPVIFNWAQENEGVHRTLLKLKLMKQLPPLIIYFGASSELFEQKFDVFDKKKILSNFKTFDDEKIVSLIITFPWMSKYFYKKINYFDLGIPFEYKNYLPSNQKLDEKEVSFKLFDYEINELVTFIKDTKSNLVFITSPLNLEVEPKEICAHSSAPAVVELQQEIENQVKTGDYKVAYPTILELSEETYGNAMTSYLLGQVALGLGDHKVAREAFAMATVFDCANWRSNAVYNSIIRAHAKKNLIPLVDFDQQMSSQLSKEGLFIDNLYPQVLFYQSMIKDLGDILKNILSVNQ